MLPARYLLRRHSCDCYGGCISNSYMGFQKPPASGVRSSEIMGGLTNCEEEREEEEEVGTSSRDAGDQLCEERWLQLGIGEGIRPPSSARRSPEILADPQRDVLASELELFSPVPPAVQRPMIPAGQEKPWGLAVSGATTSPAYFQYQPVMMSSAPAGSGEIRLLRPPERHAAGVWFLLTAAHNQAREPFLPQICKSYLRIKDGRMTIRLVKKYLVRKLGLHDESEVEISCRGQRLSPMLTLQHVRDNIWQMHETSTSLTLVPESSYNEHLMTLQYGRSS